MKFDVHHKARGTLAFSLICMSGTQEANAQSALRLVGLNPEDFEVKDAADPKPSDYLDRFGEEWYVDSDSFKSKDAAA